MLLEHASWGSVFLVNVPIMALLLVLAPLLVPESRDPRPGRFDLPSAALSLLALLLVVHAMKQIVLGGPTAGAAAGLTAGLTAAAAFVHRQRRLPTPMIDLRLSADPRSAAWGRRRLVTPRRPRPGKPASRPVGAG